IQPNPLVTNEEWPNLFRGDVARGWTGRYGANQLPTGGGENAPTGRKPHFYAPVDFDGSKTRLLNYTPSDKLRLPTEPMVGLRYFAFPTLPGNDGWDNGFIPPNP